MDHGGQRLDAGHRGGAAGGGARSATHLRVAQIHGDHPVPRSRSIAVGGADARGGAADDEVRALPVTNRTLGADWADSFRLRAELVRTDQSEVKMG